MTYREMAMKLAEGDGNILFKSPIVPMEEVDRAAAPLSSYGGSPSYAGLQPMEFTGYRQDEKAWHETCYLHTNLNPPDLMAISGPDMLKFMSKYFGNTFNDGFPVGKCKHGIMLNEEGYVMMHGLILRSEENEIQAFFLNPWLQYCLDTCGMDVSYRNISETMFIYQLGGPTSLQIVEAATGENLHDIKFVHHRMSKIAGKDVRIARMGMAGSLAYEIHGRVEDALPIYEKVMKAGKKYGLVRMGSMAYNMTHWENGFPNYGVDFLSPWFEDKGFKAWAEKSGSFIFDFGMDLSGSMGQDIRLRYRNPIECGWGRTVNYNHEFIGKEALEHIKETSRVMVTLEWNVEDILDIHRNQLTPGEEPYADISEPDDISRGITPPYHADQVLSADGDCIGISTGRMLSWYYRSMISIAAVEPAYAEIGKELYVLWGEPGTRQKKIRAKVAQYPYLQTDRNEKVDVESIPVGTMD